MLADAPPPPSASAKMRAPSCAYPETPSASSHSPQTRRAALGSIFCPSSAVAGSATMRSVASACENSIAIAVSLVCQALGGSPAGENRSRIDW